MAVTLEDIRRERERRLANPAQTLAPMAQEPPKTGITLQDIQAERARRASGGYDPFNPVDKAAGPSGDRRVNPAAEAVQEAFNPAAAALGGAAMAPGLLSRAIGAFAGGTSGSSDDAAGPAAGEVIGGRIGALAGPAAPVASPLLASAGAGIGLATSRWLQGEPVTMQEITGESLTSLIPEAITHGGRAVLRASKQAKRARFSDLATQARHEAGEVFQPPEAAMVSGLFEQVAESGVRVDTSAIQKFTGNLGNRYDDLLKEVRRIDTSLKSGGQFEDLVSRLQAGQRGAFDIGRLQTLRSEVRKRKGLNKLTFEAQELLGDFQSSIDDAIYNGLAKGQHATRAESTRDTLKVARAGYAKLRRTEELQGIVESAITSDKSGKGVEINLGRIRDELRKGRGRASQSIRRGFEHDPTAKKQFNDFLDRAADQHDSINVSLGDLPPQLLGQSIATLGNVMAAIYSSTPAGRRSFEQLMTSGQGKFTHSTLANLANVARRELEGQSAEARERRGSALPVQNPSRTVPSAP